MLSLLDPRLARLLLAVVVGATLGVGTAFTVNCTLIEISINAFFAFYFGFVFLLIGVIILYRMWTGDHPYPYLLAVFGCLILAAGVLSLMLREQWFLRLDPTTKVPVYSLLGVAVCFSLLFSLFDVCQSCISACWSSESVRPLISTTAQIYLLVATSCAMGVCFGYAFGVMDIEDEEISHLKAALDREDDVCYPIGAFIGAISAVVHQQLPGYSAQSAAYEPMHAYEHEFQQDLDEETI